MYANGDLFLSSSLLKGPISSEIFWYYFHCPKNVLCSILSFVFWIFPPSDTAVQLESADSKHNTISKSLFQDSFRHIFWAMRKMHHTFWKKATFSVGLWHFFFLFPCLCTNQKPKLSWSHLIFLRSCAHFVLTIFLELMCVRYYCDNRN